jgi:TM2 domain-containing membrane protein YozV
MSETIYCTKCGAMNTSDSSFCSSCGASLAPPKEVISPPPRTTAPPPPSPYMPPPPSTTAPPSYPTPGLTDAQLMAARKNEGISVVLTILLAGLGHLYIGKIKRGLVFIVITIVVGWIIGTVLLFIPTIIWYLYAIYDSYNLTKRYNATLYSLRRVPQEDEF